MRYYGEIQHPADTGSMALAICSYPARPIKFSNLDPENAKVIVCHLGNGASVSASIGGKCVDTSMGPTPLEGLIIGEPEVVTLIRSVVQFICNKEGKDVNEVLNILNKKSGVYGMSGGVSSDFRDIEAAAKSGNHLAEVALDAFPLSCSKIHWRLHRSYERC